MKLFLIYLITGMLQLAYIQVVTAGETDQPAYQDMVKNIRWLGQAAIRITVEDKVIYIDPFKIKNEKKADFILITHEHGDHLSKDDISKIITGKTVLIAPASCKDALKDIQAKKTILLKPGEHCENSGIKIDAVPAYNIKKTKFHPKNNNWLGYVLTINDVKIYHAGDTERIPEMKTFECDIALLPLGQTYTMNSVEEAAEAALDVKAKIAIPIHYGMYEGKDEDAKTFSNLLAGKVSVIIKEKE